VPELRGITWDHPRGVAPLTASAASYAERTGVTVRWDRRSLKDFGDAPLNRLARDYDLLIVDHPHMGMAHEASCLLPLDHLLDPNVLTALAGESAGASHDSYFYRDHQWALANDAAMQTSVCRPDLWTRDFPASWEDVPPAAQALRRNGLWLGIPLVPTDAACTFFSLCAALDAPVAAGQRLTDPRAGLHALELLKQICALAYPDSLTWNPIRLLDHMSHQDDVAYCPATFCYTNYSRDGYAPHRLRFHDIPGVKGSVLGGAGIAVSAFSACAAEAAVYAAWIASGPVQRTLYVEAGGQPGNRTAWESDLANAITHGFFRDVRATLDHAWVRSRSPAWPAFQEALGNIIHACLRDDSGTQACLAQLEHLFDETLASQLQEN
jgi:multiple sugar transport system substrate-binding protein